MDIWIVAESLQQSGLHIIIQKNNARYVNPQTGAVYKNMTKTIDGVNYRFDKYGNRVNDRTSEFKTQ